MTSNELLEKINNISNKISMTTGRLQEIEKNLLELGVTQDQINIMRSKPNVLQMEIEKHRSIINELIEKKNSIINEVTPLLEENQ